jgi:hypothetical protein
MKPATREWVKKAENDFKVASQILRRDGRTSLAALGAWLVGV